MRSDRASCSARPKTASTISAAAIEAGADEYVMKPFDRETLEGKITARRHRLRSLLEVFGGSTRNPDTRSRAVGADGAGDARRRQSCRPRHPRTDCSISGRGSRFARRSRSAHDALDYLAREPVDVVVLDIEMPGMNGIDALPHILERAERARVLILSSNCVEGGPAAIDALALGASDTLAKPGRGSFSGRFAEVLTDRIMTLGHQREFPLTVPVAERRLPGTRGAGRSIPTSRSNASRSRHRPAASRPSAISSPNLDARITAPILLTSICPTPSWNFTPSRSQR